MSIFKTEPRYHFREFTGLVPGKLYPFNVGTVTPNDFGSLTDRLPEIDNPIASLLLAAALHDYYENKQVNKPKLITVLQKVCRDNGAAKYFTDAHYQVIGEWFSQEKARKQLWFEAYQGPINWERGDFGNPKSCFWSERPNARLELEQIFEENYGAAIRIYSSQGRGPAHEDNPAKRGWGRMWAVMHYNGLVVFNPYPEHSYFAVYAQSLARAIAEVSCNELQVSGTLETEFLGSQIYVNKGQGIYLGAKTRNYPIKPQINGYYSMEVENDEDED